jgi:dTDP-glucose 4,6-dehydratase
MLFLLQHIQPVKHNAWTIGRPDRFNIVGSRQVSNLEMALLIADFIGQPLQWEPMDCTANRPGHDVHYGLDGTKLADLGWTPPHTFEWSLQQTVEWYERNPQWLTLE